MTIIDDTRTDIEYLPIAYAMARTMAEVDVLAAMLADTATQYPIAREAGLWWGHFDNPDLRIIFCATGADHARGAGACLKLARIGLRNAGYWDEAVCVRRPETSLWWRDERLGRLPAMEVNPDVTRWAAERLIDLAERAKAATAAYLACWELVGEGVGHE